jgi:type IV pilus assembly protein PilC
MIGEGKTVSEAMATHPGFDKTYCSLVKAGEAGGMLDGILLKLASHMEKQAKIRQQIKSALTYPSFVVVIGGLVIWGMMVFMVPVFVGMLKENNSEIPAITQFVMDLSAFVSKYSLFILISIIGGVFFFKNFIKTSEGKVAWNRFSMKVPVFGLIIIKGELAGFASTLGTLLASGVSLLDGLDICIEAMDNDVIASDLKEVKKKIMEGQTLGEPLSRIEYFPTLITQMVKIGEQTGQLDDMLVKIAKVFEDELEVLIGEMTKMIEPFIIVVLGGCVGGMLVAMYLPMFKSAG